MDDPLRHPDLVDLGRELRKRFAAVSSAEQEAAAAVRRRRRTLRDRLLDAEDRNDRIRVWTAAATFSGTVEAVGADHLVIATTASELTIGLDHIVGVETTR